MRRVASSWAAFAALVALAAIAGCGDARPAAAPLAGESGCSSCHSGPGEAPPFRDQTGSTDPARLTVGAHDAHLHPTVTAPLACAECHTTPRAVADPGHLDESPGDLSFGTLARTGGASPTYTTPTCSTVYCHGTFPGGNAQEKLWVGGAAKAVCGSCHDLPPPTGRHELHEGRSFEGEGITCATCHGPTVAATHVNGIRDVVLEVWDAQFGACAQACHQARNWDDRASEAASGR